jgi:hypothetical protein
MNIDAREKNILRELAKEVGDISRNALWEEKRRLWRDKNALKKVRPLILCSLPGEAWAEIIPESTLRVRDPLFRKYELELRQKIFRWENIGDDEIISDKIYVPIQRRLTDWIDNRVRPYSGQADKSAAFAPSIVEHHDLGKLKFPRLSVDWNKSEKLLEEVQEIFGDILEVILGEPFYAATDGEVMGWGYSLIDILCELRGLENIFNDLYSCPSFVHEAMDFLMRGTLKYLDDLERENLLVLNNNEFISASNTPLGSNGLACSEELPGEPFDPGRVATGNLWGYAQAQEFSEVSPDMHEEFVLPYQQKIADRFGLNCYGCCEGNDRKWDRIIKHIPRLRQLSVSFAASLEIAADTLKDNYVLSWKPHPVRMIAGFDERNIRRELKIGFEQAKGSCLIVCLRDTQTLYGEPERASVWTRVAMELAEQFE